MERLEEGMLLDYTKPMTPEFIEYIRLLMNGNTEKHSDIAFMVKDNRFMHFTCSCGNYETALIDKYNSQSTVKISELARGCDCGNQIIIDEFDAGSNDFYCIGSQIAVCYHDEDRIQIRIIPYGAKIDDSIYIKVADYAYYLSYDKQKNYISWDPQLIFEPDELGKFIPVHEYFDNIPDDDNRSALSYYNEEMMFGYEFKPVSDSCKNLFALMKPYVPLLCGNEIKDDIFAMADSIIRQIVYPIFSNSEAQPFLKDKFGYYDDFPSYMRKMKEFGFNPEQYGFKDCFNVDRNEVEGTSFDDIFATKRWNDTIRLNGLENLIAYYTDTAGKQITMEVKKRLLDFPSESGSFVTYLKYILRGAIAEDLDISNTISHVQSCMRSGIIKSWSGRYSERLWNKANALNTTKLPLDYISQIEKNATLDYLYKKLTTI